MNCQGVVLLGSTGLRLDLVFFLGSLYNECVLLLMINLLLILLKLAPHLKPVTFLVHCILVRIVIVN